MMKKTIDGKTLEQWVEEQSKAYETTFWGEKCMCTPELIEEKHGDGLQLVYLKPIDTRPNFYLLLIDSKINVSDDDSLSDDDKEEYGDISELLLRLVETEHTNIDHYSENSDGLYYDEYDDSVEPFEFEWPMLSWCGGSWGSIVNFGV